MSASVIWKFRLMDEKIEKSKPAKKDRRFAALKDVIKESKQSEMRGVQMPSQSTKSALPPPGPPQPQGSSSTAARARRGPKNAASVVTSAAKEEEPAADGSHDELFRAPSLEQLVLDKHSQLEGDYRAKQALAVPSVWRFLDANLKIAGDLEKVFHVKFSRVSQ